LFFFFKNLRKLICCSDLILIEKLKPKKKARENPVQQRDAAETLWQFKMAAMLLDEVSSPAQVRNAGALLIAGGTGVRAATSPALTFEDLDQLIETREIKMLIRKKNSIQTVVLAKSYILYTDLEKNI
jgi:hypothetical protein